MRSFLFCVFSILTVYSQEPAGIKEGTLVNAADWNLALTLPHEVPVFEAENQDRYLLFRIRQDDAEALELKFTSMHLPENARMFVYNNSGSGTRQVFGPITGSGSDETGEMALLLAGPESYIEVQIGQGELAEIPFTLTVTVKQNYETGAPETFSTLGGGAERRSSHYRGNDLDHLVQGGVAIFEGDILLGRVDELEASSQTRQPAVNGAAINGAQYRWPGGVMPYVINAGFPNPQRVLDAIAHWNTKMGGSVQLVPRTNQANYVVVTDPGVSTTCNSYVGMIGGAQPVNLGGYCSSGNAIHELGHALGFWHEQSRIDRDQFIRIATENIEASMIFNFNKTSASNGIDLGAYDYNSIMHYPAYAFSKNGQATIVTIPAGIPIGQRDALSDKDVAAMKILYPAAAAAQVMRPRVRITIGSTPTGIPVTVDGQKVNTPASFDWEVGSNHQLLADASVNGSTGVRVQFVRWNVNAVNGFTYTVPAAAAAVTAQYVLQYALRTATNDANLGAVTVTPVAADTFYNASTVLKMEAKAAANSCFTGWTGLLPTAPASLQLQVNAPGSITGMFKAGSVTVLPLSNQITKNGGTMSLQVTAAGCPWQAQSASDWARLSGIIGGTQSGKLTISVTPNTTGQTRTAVITLGPLQFTIAQPGK